MKNPFFLFVVFLFGLSLSDAFYLPGVAPYNYKQGEPVKLKVNKLTSPHSVISYAYYDAPFCRPEDTHEDLENLGESLRGDHIQPSLYALRARVPATGKALCRDALDEKKAKRFAQLIKAQYRVHAIVDNLPAATKLIMENTRTKEDTVFYERGFLIGFTGGRHHANTVDGKLYLNNHLSIRILTHPVRIGGKNRYRIVGFEVHPYSHAHDFKGKWDDAEVANYTVKSPRDIPVSERKPVEVATGADVIYSYDVSWEDSEIKWSSRWDMYLAMKDPQIHWFSIVNSMLIIFFLTAMVAMILVKVLHRDFARYNQLETAEEAREETGWKLVHGDVFRPPPYGSLLSVCVGTGVQLCLMTILTVVFAALGFLSPANRGALLATAVLLFDILSVAAGYFSARFYKFFKGTDWKANTLLTTFLFPGSTFLSFFVLNYVISGSQSKSGAAPTMAIFILIVLWFGFSMPLVFFGAFLGFKKPEYEVPVRTNVIPRQIPDVPAYLSTPVIALVGGVLPFGAVLIELYFVLTSLWQGQTYYMFGFMLIVTIILAVTCAEISIVFCYFTLCGEDYRWQWRSFFTSGASAIYVFGYSINYLKYLQFGRGVDIFLYVGYMAMISCGFFLVTGCIGFLSSFLFVRKIYGAIKVD